jgi:hypothetical protein
MRHILYAGGALRQVGVSILVSRKSRSFDDRNSICGLFSQPKENCQDGPPAMGESGNYAGRSELRVHGN